MEHQLLLILTGQVVNLRFSDGKWFVLVSLFVLSDPVFGDFGRI